MAVIQNTDIYIGACLFGIFTGIGNVIGQYIWKKFFLHKIEGIRKRIKNKHNGIMNKIKVIMTKIKRFIRGL